MTIHTADCFNALAADPKRRIEARWALDGDTTFPTRIRIYSADKKGMLATMSSSISGNGVNIIGAQIRTTGDGNAESTFDIEIGSLKQLKKIIHALHNIDGVMKVERIREWQGPVGP